MITFKALDERGPVDFPLLVESSGSQSLLDCLSSNREQIRDRLIESGSILFRGYSIDSADAFADATRGITTDALNYIYRSTPRTSLGSRVFSATEFPPALEIPLHCENAYQRDWPTLLAFACIKAATTGGETPLSNVRAVTRAVGDEILSEFERRGVKYMRHYRPYVDLSWQTVFQTEDRAQVGAYCDAHDIEYEWIAEDRLRTVQVCQGAATHPQTGEKLLFNQAHLFHVSSMGEAAARSLIDVFGADELPRNAYFGDGGEIPTAMLERVRQAYADHSVQFPWRDGDVLLVDNMQVAHGRRPYTGDRKVLVSLFKPYSEGGY